MRSTYQAPKIEPRRFRIDWREVAAQVVVCLAVIVLIVAAFGAGQMVAHDEVSHGGTSLPACPTEDSDDCYWDARLHGNGAGRSFVTVDGVTLYSDGSTTAWESER